MSLSVKCPRCGQVTVPTKLRENDSVFVRLTPGRASINMVCRECRDLTGWQRTDGISLLHHLMAMGFDHSPDGAGLAPLGMVSCLDCRSRFSPRKWGPETHQRWEVRLDLQGGPWAIEVSCPRCARGLAIVFAETGKHRPEQVAAMFLDVLLFVFPPTVGDRLAAPGHAAARPGPRVG